MNTFNSNWFFFFKKDVTFNATITFEQKEKTNPRNNNCENIAKKSRF